MLAMITSLKNNRALLRSSYRPRMSRKARHHATGPIIYDHEMSREQLDSFKVRLRRERIRRDIGKICTLLLALGIAMTLISLMFKAILQM